MTIWPGVKFTIRAWSWPFVQVACYWPDALGPVPAGAYSCVHGNGLGLEEALRHACDVGRLRA